jgi:hypothetical protein
MDNRAKEVRARAGVSRRSCILPFPQSTPFTPAATRIPLHTPAYHVEHSPESRWIVSAASLNRRTPGCSSQVRQSKRYYLGSDRCHPDPICDLRYHRCVPMPAHMYLFVPMYQGSPHHHNARSLLLSDQKQACLIGDAARCTLGPHDLLTGEPTSKFFSTRLSPLSDPPMVPCLIPATNARHGIVHCITDTPSHGRSS